MLDFSVTQKKQDELEKLMKRAGISDADMEEKFIRSSGKGGQKVNKSSTCVYLKHIPTGIEVKCQQERSQSTNRFLARRILAEKVESLILGRISLKQQKAEKLRRQKRKRSKRAKDKMLDEKKQRSEVKVMRKPVSFAE